MRQAIPGARIRPSHLFIEFTKEETEQSIGDRFEQQVARYPDWLALKTSTHQFTYDELNRAANRVARAILAKRGPVNEPIAIALEHGASSIISMLGILKAGKICVPLDPSCPPARLRYLLEDSQASLVISQAEVLSLAGDIAQTPGGVIDIDAISHLSGENLGLDIGPDTRACIIYTSGSTGEPKGVLQNHRNLLFEVRKLTNSFYVSSIDRISHLLVYTVIGGVREIFAALLNGAGLFPFDIKKEGIAGLASWLIGQQITVCRSVSTVFRSFMASLNSQERFPNLRLIYLGGENTYKKDFELCQKHISPECRCVNVYGATETGLSLHYFADARAEFAGINVPLGFPTEGTEVLLLDDQGRSVGTHQIGEIIVKSPYLALGYWRKPLLTQAAFSMESTEENTRIYRTGDLGRMLGDGSIEYVGRKDFQAEVRGHRVEVAEIEAALLCLDSVKEAVVVCQNDRHGEHALIAYVVPVTRVKPTVAALRQALSERLPTYMIPSAFVFMDALPLAGIGKVDRNALPVPDQAWPSLETEFVKPENSLELRLAGIWEEVLGVHPIGVKDNFFELGGHSLQAIELVAHIGKVFGKHLPPAILFESPTIKQLASGLGRAERDWSSLVPIQPHGSKPPFFWIHGDSSNVFLPGYLGPDQPFYGLEHQAQDGRPALYCQVENIAAHYLAEIRTVQRQGPYFLGGYSFGGIVAFEIAQQLTKEGEKPAFLFMIDSYFPGVAESAYEKRPTGSVTAVTGLAHRIARHLHSLSRLRPRHKLDYVRIRAGEKWQESVAGLTKISQRAAYTAYLAVGRSLPATLRSRYILDIYYRAVQEYLPRLYSGRAMYIKSQKRSAEHAFEWSRLFAGGLEVHEVPGDHMEVIAGTNALLWAEKLKAGLRRAQDLKIAS